MLNNYSNEQLRLAARLYYLDGLPQMDVAKMVNVSQAKVSRLLALARERGIVRITVEDYSPRQSDLEKAIKTQLGLKNVAVIKTAEGMSAKDLRHSVGRFSAEFVDSLISAKCTVAIAGGRAICELIKLLPESKNKKLTVIQAMGSVDANVSAVDALELGGKLAERYSGSFVTLNTPAYVPDKKTRDAFLQLEQIQAIRKRLHQADVAIVGIGTLENSVFVERGVLKASAIASLKSAGAVGELCGRFFDKNGKECNTEWRDRVIGIEFSQLKKIPQVIAIVAGSDRSAAICAAVKAGLLKSLVIDEAGARALLTQSAAVFQPTLRNHLSRRKSRLEADGTLH